MKGESLRWFIGPDGNTITSWDEIKKTLLGKYQEYCRSRELKDDFFKILEKEEENLEEFIDCFQYNVQRTLYVALGGDILKTNLIKGI